MGRKKQRTARSHAHYTGRIDATDLTGPMDPMDPMDPADTTHFKNRRDDRKVTEAEVNRCLKVGKRSMLQNYNLRYHDATTGVVVITDAHNRVKLTAWRCDVGDHDDDYEFKHDFPSMPSAAAKDPSVQRHMHQWASSLLRMKHSFVSFWG